MPHPHHDMALVMDDGEIVAVAEARLRRFCPQLDNETFTTFAVRNLGAAAVLDRGDCLRIRWRPEGMTQATLAGLVHWLVDRADRRVVVSRLGRTWTHTLVPSRRLAVNILLETHDAGNRRTRRFYAARRQLAEGLCRRPFRDALDYAEAHSGVLDESRTATLGDGILQGRYILLKAEGDHLVLHRVGTGFQTIDPRWRSLATRLELEDQPDCAYGRWVSSAYREAVAAGLPLVDDVDAEVEFAPDRHVRLRYRRLILPAAGTEGQRLLLGTSEIDPTINLGP